MKTNLLNSAERCVSLLENNKMELNHLLSPFECEVRIQIFNEILERTATEGKGNGKMIEMLSTITNEVVEKVKDIQQVYRLYQLFQKWPTLITSSVMLSIIGNRWLIADVRFVQFYIEPMRSSSFAKEKKIHVFSTWLNSDNGVMNCVDYIIKYQLDWEPFQSMFQPDGPQKLSDYLDKNFLNILKLLSCKSMPYNFKEKIIKLIHCKWTAKHTSGTPVALSTTERMECIKTVSDWMKETSQRVVISELIYTLLEGFNPFRAIDRVDLITYMTSEEGLQLF
ncbi:hypothetical protein RFI_10192 [Reticulomyxa filosa]|uniref:Uncharacterized protein n=1 Tax=Reticulomyxa filosa TaxID=46433 RepID=X6NNK0_RETFI|nr:hypothetical protein RFI_10192 [Reticulomyxa filosa]|eukprot:ETO26942.1 hypothetical protein RFI_10192 [Reticulomyxa filosa]